MTRHPPATLMKLATALAASSALFAGGCAGAAGAVPAAAPLWLAQGGGFTAAPGKADPKAPCQLLSVSLKLAEGGSPPPPKLFGAPSPCQTTSLYIGDLRGTLFVEGLDASGARLFVATGLNPQHQDVEAPPSSSGPGMAWRGADATPVPVLTTTIRAPLTPALSRLRWYDVDAQDQPRLLGEAAWTAP